MSHWVNDQIIDNITTDVMSLVETKGVWGMGGVVDTIAAEFGTEKLPHTKDDDELIDALIEMRFENMGGE